MTNTAVNDSSTHVLTNIVVGYADTDVWSGQRKLFDEDLPDGFRLYRGKGVSGGAKKLVDPETLLPFRACTEDIERTFAEVGIRFCRGWAIPADKAAEVRSKIKAIETRWNDLVSAFLYSLPSNVEAWARKNPDLADAIRASAPESAAVARAFGFSSCFYRLNTVAEVGDDESLEDLNQITNELRRGIWVDIAARAAHSVKRLVVDRPYGNNYLRNHLLALRGKLAGLSFLNGKVAGIVSLIDDLLSEFDTTNRVVGEDWIRVASALYMLRTPNGVVDFVEGRADPKQFENSVRPGIEAAVAEWNAKAEEDHVKYGRPLRTLKPGKKRAKAVNPEPKPAESRVLPEFVPEAAPVPTASFAEALPEVPADAPVPTLSPEPVPAAEPAEAVSVPETPAAEPTEAVPAAAEPVTAPEKAKPKRRRTAVRVERQRKPEPEPVKPAEYENDSDLFAALGLPDLASLGF